MSNTPSENTPKFSDPPFSELPIIKYGNIAATFLSLLYAIYTAIETKKPEDVVWPAVIFAIFALISFGLYTTNRYWRLSKAQLKTLLDLNATASEEISKLKTEAIQFNRIFKDFHRINHIYRNSLCELFVDNPQEYTDPRETLGTICNHIGNIFKLLTGSDCQITIKLIAEEISNNTKILYCQTYARNGGKNVRDEPPIKYIVKNNTAFTTASNYQGGDRISHYWSADLTKDTNYCSDRLDYLKFYTSVIVVPIRYVSKNDHRHIYDTGFLTVDTLETNRLNDYSHVLLLASFADQCYNYLSLVRGKYRLKGSTT
jgi:hypothetical protein